MFKDIKIAVRERDRQRVTFTEFSSSIPEKYTAEWEQLVIAYEEDPSDENPYEETVASKFTKRLLDYAV